jgi:hypothetical protein
MISTEKPFYKAILLVLASDNTELYRQFKQVYEHYIDSNPNVKVLFVYGRDVSFDVKPYDLVYDVEENYYPGMITKTVRAFEHINRSYDYDFLVRTNLSTFWDINRLCKRLNRLPTTQCASGTFRQCVYKGRRSPEYIAGVNLVVSRDVVQHFIDHQDRLIEWDLPEDWALSQLLLDDGIKLIQSRPGAIHFMDKFTSFDEAKVLSEVAAAQQMNHDHFRIKNKDRGNIDIQIANVLLREYYGQTIL